MSAELTLFPLSAEIVSKLAVRSAD